MSTFDPTTIRKIRKAVDEFTACRPQRFHDLALAKEVIIELRQKRAAYQAIADLLSQHCLVVSKTSVAAFCHQVLGETVRPRRRSNRKRSTPANSHGQSAKTSEEAVATIAQAEQSGAGATNDTPRLRGPRIAQVRLARNS